MRNGRERSTAAQMVIGVAVILMGSAFLLDNLGWLDLHYDIQFWPVILIVVGTLKIMQSQSGRGAIVGGGLLLLGALLMLKGLGFLHISWRVVAPLLIIGAGLMVVFKSTRKQASMESTAGTTLAADGERALNIAAILGGFQRRVTTPDFRGGEITTIMAGCELDLRESSIQNEAVLNVFAMMGGITIKVPLDWTVEMEGTPILGGFDEKTVAPKDRSKRLIVRGYAIMGGVEIRN